MGHGKMGHGKNRWVALVLALLLLFPNFAFAEGEMLESPSLPDEPVATCEHTNVSEAVIPSGSRCVPETEWTHRFEFYDIVERTCNDCGALLFAGEVLTSTSTGVHQVDTSGVCYACGAQIDCPHDLKRQCYVQYTAEYTDVTPSTHTANFDSYIYEVCLRCSAIWRDFYNTVRVSEVQPHVFEDGVCRDCGYIEVCTHENTQLIWETVSTTANNVKVDANTHIASYVRKQYPRCLDCGKILYDDSTGEYEEFEVTEPHVYITSLQCERCGYVPMDDEVWPEYECSHEWEVLQRTVESTQYASIDERTHRGDVYTVTQTECKSCHEVTNLTEPRLVSSFTEEHVFGYPEGKNVVCVHCGYETCGHTEVLNESETVYRYAPSYFSKAKHTRSEYEIVRRVCADCQEVLSEEEEVLIETIEEDHTFGEDGLCTKCGAQPCKHENKYQVGTDDEPIYEYESIDAWIHKNTVTIEMVWYCPSCGTYLEPETEVYAYNETHNFGDGDICQDCGAKGICPHDLTVLVYDPMFTDVVGDFTYEPYDEVYHVGSYEARPIVHCQRCGKSWVDESLPVERVEEFWAHDEMDGVCVDCGMPVEPQITPDACEHAHTQIIQMWLDGSTSEPVDANTHRTTGTRSTYLECNDCYAMVGEETVEENVTAIEPHDMFLAEDGMLCWTCDYTPNVGDVIPEGGLPTYECPHEYPEERTIVGEGYIPADENGHIASTYRKAQVFCARCGSVLEEEVTYEANEGATAEPHAFEDGVCTVCGYACPHADTYEWYEPDYDASTYTPVDAWTHTYAEHGTLQTVCENCGATVSEKEEVRTGTGSHAYFDGVCDLCGAENACPHDLTTVEYIWEEETYVKIDENTHKKAYDAEGYIRCLRCGEDVGTTPVRHVEMIEEHSFYEGECYCGATCEVVQCDHANRVEVWDPEDDEVVELTGTDVYNHTGVFKRYFYPMCVDCGERFYHEGHWETVTGTSAHYFDFVLTLPGVGCMVCGYVPGAEADKFVCEHEETMTQTVSGEEYRPVEGSNAHILTRYTVEQTVCTSNPWRCGQILAEKVISSTPVEGATEEIHTFDADGVCTVCGYKQLTDPDDPAEPAPTPTPTPVATATPTPVPTAIPTPVPSDEPAAPTATPAPTAEPVAPTATPVPTAEPAPTAESVAPTATPAPTPAPVFTEMPASEEVHGVKAEDNVPMVEALATVVDAIAAEEETATVQIANVERVVTAEEKEALDALPVKEQLFTFLSVIGFEEQVDKTLSTSGEALSEPAQALKAQIQERVAAMTQQERAAFEETLLSSFPQEVIELDGVEYTFFVLELEVRVGDTVRIERYGFRLEGEEWIFTRLEVADQPPAAA